MTSAPADIRPLHILILTDRDWTHPQGGGTGTNLYGQVARWLQWGHRVTVIGGAHPGAPRCQRPHARLTLYHVGSRLTVFPRAAWLVARGVGRDADVVLEVINGIAFFTPLWPWLRRPRVALVHHVHQHHYVSELGLQGRIAAWLLERLPLRYLYRSTPFVTISLAARADLVGLGIPAEQVHVSYLGVEPSQFRDSRPATEPTLLYLGRLKQYKRIEVVLDVLEAVPEARLEIAGEGDHRASLEHEIERRGLSGRVRLHGFVDEADKAELYARAWVALTASSAEGWCLTVMEAGACATPSAALNVGGLPESIVDGQTGLLADTPAELSARVGELIRSPARRDELGLAAQARARGFSWESTASATLGVLNDAAEAGRSPLRTRLAGSGLAKAGGLAGATLVNNAIQVLFTVVFTRLLGVSGYGSLAALISAFLILLVGGQALQVAAAREVALHRLGRPAEMAASIRGWTRTLLAATVALGGAAMLLRAPLAEVVGVPQHAWAAAAIVPTASLWLLLSLKRGVLQGLHSYAAVGASIVLEPAGRLFIGLALVLAGSGVTGAYLGTPLAMLLTSSALGWLLHRRLTISDATWVPAGASGPPAEMPATAASGSPAGVPAAGASAGGRPARPLRSLVSDAWLPLVALTLLALLQNVDVIVVRHQVGGSRAGSYAAAAVAAKAVVWVGIGISLYLLPEAARRAAAGLDPRPVLLRGLAVLALVALPELLVFALAPDLLLSLALGAAYTQASGALVLLGLAMTLL
ncbi:MAG TPA: glycosyltransferase, partial [Solirubrobacteraceae bacterium]|nr:glycosyltransferase [Solirubrobacteraceae bacterium]